MGTTRSLKFPCGPRKLGGLMGRPKIEVSDLIDPNVHRSNNSQESALTEVGLMVFHLH